MLKYGIFSGPYFPAFGLNTERYSVSLSIQFECGEIQTRETSVFGHFSCSVTKQCKFGRLVQFRLVKRKFNLSDLTKQNDEFRLVKYI